MALATLALPEVCISFRRGEAEDKRSIGPPLPLARWPDVGQSVLYPLAGMEAAYRIRADFSLALLTKAILPDSSLPLILPGQDPLELETRLAV